MMCTCILNVVMHNYTDPGDMTDSDDRYTDHCVIFLYPCDEYNFQSLLYTYTSDIQLFIVQNYLPLEKEITFLI